MKRFFQLTIIAAIAAFLSGCIEMKVHVNVKKDGSGTVSIENYLGPQAIAMSQMKFGEGEKQDPEAAKKKMKEDMLDEAQYKKMASEMGEGVTFKSVKYVERKDGFVGFKAIFDFKDLNKLNPKLIKENKKQGGSMDTPPVKFTFTKGPEAKITMVLQDEKGDEKEKPADEKKPTEAEIDQQLNMMNMMSGVKIDYTLSVDGKIASSTAAHVDKEKGTVTIASLNLDEMLKDRESLKKALLAGAEDPAEMAKFNVKGLKAQEIGKEISVTFK